MRINFYGYQLGFRGRREDRNTISQLKNNNDYSLTEINQRRINQAIKNLSQYSDEENLDFLLDVADNLQYGTSINTGKPVKNDWKAKLKNTAQTSLASNPILKEKYEPKINQVFNTKKPLTNTEKEIILHKNSIINQADLNSLKDNKNENIRSLERNINYFVSSTEIPTQQKLYVLKRLDYFMSPEYKINPQLEDKKTQVLAEMMNDLTINTFESKIPNIKAINQKNHGMCAAISIARKAIAYEDKPNYVDSLLSELDDTPQIMVYDRFNLGSGKKVPVKKVFIDFDYAMSKGYRIVDASTAQWMNIADMYGINNENLQDYNGFDKRNFDAFQDAHFVKNFEDDRLMPKQCYYQALTKAHNDIGSLKSYILKTEENRTDNKNSFRQNVEISGKESRLIREKLKKLQPALDNRKIDMLTSQLISLQKHFSEKIAKDKTDMAKYSFIPNEEYSQKLKKITAFLTDKLELDKNIIDIEKTAEEITNSVITVNEIKDTILPKHTISDEVRLARKAYEAEAIYRASKVLGLTETDVLTDNMIKYNVLDRESLISKSLGILIKTLETTDNQKLINHIAAMFKMSSDNKEDIIKGMRAVKVNFDSGMTEVLDKLYNKMGLGSRQDNLAEEVRTSIDEVEAGEKNEQARLAEIFNVKNDKKTILTILKKFEKELSADNISEEKYISILNKLGYKNQLEEFVEKFQEIMKSINDEDYPNRDENIKIFKDINELDKDSSTEDIMKVFTNIGTTFNKLSNDVEIAAQIIESCLNSDEKLIPKNSNLFKSLSINAKDIILKKMENNGELIPEFVMTKLQDRFAKIDEIKSSDEFSSRQGKISQPELYKLTTEEKNAIKHINKKLNKMYSEVTRALNSQYREIKPVLEELMRQIGSGKGSYWVLNEGQSGLSSAQQVKIFEQITDKPYYTEEDLDTAVDMILNGTHSGVSGTSVFHNKIGAHAQYIADIKKEGTNGKYVLYHDNTWGAAEHENTWIDSEGITRTDYSDRRGGELGYITNEYWRNGNYIDNLKFKKGTVVPDTIKNKTYKKINPEYDREYDFPLLFDTIINGENPKLRNIAGSIKDTMYIPYKNWLSSIEKLASNMSIKEIEKANIGADAAIIGYKKNYEDIIKRIEKTPFNKGINSKEDYDKLSDDDPLKITFEKTAVKTANPNFYMYEALGKAKTVKDIAAIQEKLKINAKNDFNYAFGKDKDILLYYSYEYSRDISRKLVDILKKNKVTFDLNVIPGIFYNTAYYTKEESSQFTGSIKDSINFVLNKTLKQFDENIPTDENSLKAREEFKNLLSDLLNNIMYFNEKDLTSGKFRAKAIRKWIDRTFEPSTDEEFIKIYRKLQDMTTEEFNKYTENLTNEDLGIKPITGYDILVKVKAANEKAETELKNTLYYQEFVKNVKISKTEPAYKYSKNQKSLRGVFYKGGRTFDDLYRSFIMSLSTIEYEKMFNKYKDENYRKYKAIPAYPKIELVTEMALDYKLSDIDQTTSETLNNIKLRKTIMGSINLIKKLDKLVSKIPDDKPLNKKEISILKNMIGEFITNNYEDPDITDALNAANEILNFSDTTPAGQYKPLIKTIIDEYKIIEKSNAELPFKELNEESWKYLQEYYNVLFNCNIPPRFRRKLKEELKTWISEEFKKQDKTIIRNEGSIEIRTKLDEMSIKNNSKGKLEIFDKLQTQICIAKLIKNSENFNKEEFEERIKKANEMADSYMKKYIKPEFKNQAERFLKFYIKKESGTAKKHTFDLHTCEAAKNRFFEDFKKYHYTKYPQEVFKSYLLSAAKDSKTSRYKDNYKILMENHLDSATLINIQDLLMEAVNTGNAAEVRKHFKDYYVYPFKSPFAQTMDSPESISYIVKNLLINNNNETAKMFVEKLGLADTILDFEALEFKALNLDKHIKSIVNIASTTQKNMLIAREEIEKISNLLDKTDDFERLIDEAKQNIIKKTKRNTRQAEVKLYLEALDNAKESLQKDSDVKKSIVVDKYLDFAINEIVEKSNSESLKHQKFLNMIILLYTFLSELNLPEYSDAYKKQQDLTEKFTEFRTKYENALNQLRSVCSNIHVTGID